MPRQNGSGYIVQEVHYSAMSVGKVYVRPHARPGCPLLKVTQRLKLTGFQAETSSASGYAFELGTEFASTSVTHHVGVPD